MKQCKCIWEVGASISNCLDTSVIAFCNFCESIRCIKYNYGSTQQFTKYSYNLILYYKRRQKKLIQGFLYILSFNDSQQHNKLVLLDIKKNITKKSIRLPFVFIVHAAGLIKFQFSNRNHPLSSQFASCQYGKCDVINNDFLVLLLFFFCCFGLIYYVNKFTKQHLQLSTQLPSYLPTTDIAVCRIFIIL